MTNAFSNNSTRFRSGQVIAQALAGVACAGALFWAYAGMTFSARPQPASSLASATIANASNSLLAANETANAAGDESPTLADRFNASKILGLCGITPELLAAAGFTAAETNTIFANLADGLTNTRQSFAAAVQTHSTAKRNVEHLRSVARTSSANDQNQTDLAAAEAVYSSAVNAIESLKSSTYATALTGMSETKSQSLTRAIANRKTWQLPTQYLVVDRNEAQWVQLRDALAQARICASKGKPVPEDVSAFLATVEQDSSVAAATSAVRTNREAVLSAWASHNR